jgi:hypothetical protein
VLGSDRRVIVGSNPTPHAHHVSRETNQRESTVDTERQTEVTVEPRPKDPIAAAVYDEKLRVIDKAIRWCREEGHCNEALDGLRAIYGQSPWSDRKWYDSEGYDKSGFNVAGLDKYGFNYWGHDKDGYNHDGFNADGLDREKFYRSGYNSEGLDRTGNVAPHWCTTCKTTHRSW